MNFSPHDFREKLMSFWSINRNCKIISNQLTGWQQLFDHFRSSRLALPFLFVFFFVLAAIFVRGSLVEM